ncbi:MAG: hypothetical protein MRY78_09400 [Saprospiraceae bacterium]|nr:hypothetical protein [Saprospiraceae bacterium]
MRYLILLFFLAGISFGIAQPSGNNQVFGTVSYPHSSKKIKRGSGYNKDGTRMMHSDDPMAHPSNNIIVSLHPQSFEVEVKPMRDASITQKEQTFLPKVLPVTKGTTVYFLNEDEFFHNIYSLTPGSRFNIGRRPPGNPYPIQIKRTGLITLSCDIHPHMSGTILSLDTPYFERVDSEGRYKITSLPDGKYEMRVYYPDEKIQRRNIQINNGQLLEQHFEIKP